MCFINNVKSPVLLKEADYIFKFKKESGPRATRPPFTHYI